MPDRCSTAFSKLADVAIALGAAPLTKHYGNWVHDLPGGWHVEVNGAGQRRNGVPPYCAMLTFDGTPAGCICPAQGVFIAGCEDDFIAACQSELDRLATEVTP